VIAVESNTVSTIICFAYEIHKKQIVNAADRQSGAALRELTPK
jgi:hypothetical protein